MSAARSCVRSSCALFWSCAPTSRASTSTTSRSFPRPMQHQLFTRETDRAHWRDRSVRRRARGCSNRPTRYRCSIGLLYADIKTYLHELLMKQDQMSMAASVESRVPFLDHKLVEFTASLPETMKLRGGTTKYVLRESMKGVLAGEDPVAPQDGFSGADWQLVSRCRFKSVVDEYVAERAHPFARHLCAGLCARTRVRCTRLAKIHPNDCGRWSTSRCGNEGSSTVKNSCCRRDD